MKTRIFCGPTVSATEANEIVPGASVEGPVSLGDVLAAAEEGFRRIAIIDGYFDQRQPVWHKEILWALHQGVRVYGAASMGALRATELAPFGMIGVGRIFELFRDGWLERDDEVAVAHASQDEGYRPISDALVNMRFTFRRASKLGVVPIEFAEHCTELAERTFYAERTYSKVLAEASGSPAGRVVAHGFLSWLGPSLENRVDQKRADALELLSVLSEEQRTNAPVAPRPTFYFAQTQAWYEFRKLRSRR